MVLLGGVQYVRISLLTFCFIKIDLIILNSYDIVMTGYMHMSQENFLRDAQNDSSPALPELADAVK